MSKGDVILHPLHQGTDVTNRVRVALWHIPKDREEATLQCGFS